MLVPPFQELFIIALIPSFFCFAFDPPVMCPEDSSSSVLDDASHNNNIHVEFHDYVIRYNTVPSISAAVFVMHIYCGFVNG